MTDDNQQTEGNKNVKSTNRIHHSTGIVISLLVLYHYLYGIDYWKEPNNIEGLLDVIRLVPKII